jgi:hypothetical protein
MANIVWEYFSNVEGLTGCQQWPADKRPDLAGNPDPNDEMNKGNWRDKYGKAKWKLLNKQFELTGLTPTTIELTDEKRERLLLRFARQLLDAMYDGRTWAQCCATVKTFIDNDINGNIKP